jgi:hypothetical protein
VRRSLFVRLVIHEGEAVKIRSWTVLAALILFTFCGWSSAQSVDAFFGVNALTASQPAGVPSLGGGAFLSVGGDVFLTRSLGFYGQASWRAKQADYAGNPVRPLFYDFGAAWQPLHISSRVVPFFRAGLGAESIRVYQPFFVCGAFTGCSNYVTTNHFMGHLAVGVKFYLTPRISS